MPSGRNCRGLPGFGMSRCLTGSGQYVPLRSASRISSRNAVAGEPSPSLVQSSAVTYEIEQINKDLIGVFVAPPIQLALHVEDERDIHLAGHASTSCLLAVSTASLRHVDGFPVLGLLRRLRPLSPRSLVTSAIRCRKLPEATTRFLGFVTDLSPALGADSTPCGIWPRHHANPYRRSWHAACCVPPIHVRITRTNTPPIRGSHHRSTRPLPSWRVRGSTGASTIGSVSLAMAGSLAGPATGSEVPVRPTLMGSADLWLPGSTRFASPICSSPHVASYGVGSLTPRDQERQ